MLLLSLIFLFVSSRSFETEEAYGLQKKHVPNEVLVKFKKNVPKDLIRNAIQSVQGKIITYLGEEISVFQWDPDITSLKSFRLDPELFLIKVAETIGTERAIYFLKKNSNIEYAEENAIGYFLEITPNDDYFGLQWALKNDQDKDIDATDAWDISTGNPNIVVAVIDTGVDYNHIDLQTNIWVNEDEIPGNGIDDDHNGYIDDIHGYNFYNNNPYPFDSAGHGTHVAGIIGVVGNNDHEGVAGVNWQVKIMVLKIGESNWSTAAAVSAIDYATANGAYLSNNSYGTYSFSNSLYQAIYKAMCHQSGSGVKLFVAAAGNTDSFPEPDNDKEPIYPRLL